jgi:ubiquinone/menaquinone biosynthesis C-methylase UbiE
MSGEQPEQIWGDTSYLDAVSTLDIVRAYKRRTFELLGARPGMQLLDVGCGPGDDVRALAELVGSGGRVVGVDVREEMIAEARSRSAGQNLPVEFHLASVYQIDFADNTFDGSRADRVFQHLERPQEALAEMVRVTRSDGRVAVYDVDWETLVIDTPDRALTRKLVNYSCDIHATGWAGRMLPRLFRACGLQDIAVEPSTAIIADFVTADRLLEFRPWAEEVQAAGIISAEEGASWLESLEQAKQAGQFFSAITGFIVGGRKP